MNFEPQKVVGAGKRIERETTNTNDVHCGPRVQHGKEKCYVTSIDSEMRIALKRDENFLINRRNKTVVNETSRDNCSV